MQFLNTFRFLQSYPRQSSKGYSLYLIYVGYKIKKFQNLIKSCEKSPYYNGFSIHFVNLETLWIVSRKTCTITLPMSCKSAWPLRSGGQTSFANTVPGARALSFWSPPLLLVVWCLLGTRHATHRLTKTNGKMRHNVAYELLVRVTRKCMANAQAHWNSQSLKRSLLSIFLKLSKIAILFI